MTKLEHVAPAGQSNHQRMQQMAVQHGRVAPACLLRNAGKLLVELLQRGLPMFAHVLKGTLQRLGQMSG